MREVSAVADALIADGLAAPRDFRGCTEAEVELVIKAAPFEPPAHYVAFLRAFGHGAGRLLRGTDIFFPQPLETNNYAREVALENEVDLKVDDRFFFAHHQGYQLYFFEPNSPAVYLYTEGDEKPQKIAEDFLRYLQAKLQAERSLG
ncbi:SMI1/KNR4 family protein [Actinoallomurus rhizosphaericola]|uniref:SMI1/KNR4 family protein n=1 Tax=Actinoallomurus rhizosphaericola TaxID=2952536 RepID=UPI002093EF54|nr:SMI1/KNR4 family protein [Actinoallomurus rhizosphaericola]MCO5996264.1 SMI1/KNR4 family protein [Actinoallomurus rhizosphaericola]